MRGIYAREDETTPWMVEERFENGVPRFESKAECLEFIRAHCADKAHPSNPDLPEQAHLMHIFTMLVTWRQVEERH